MTGKRHAPGSNSSTESSSSHPLRKPRKFQKQMYSASEATHSRTDMSMEASPAHVDTPFPRSGKPLASIRQGKRQGGNGSKMNSKQYETVRLNVHGRRKEFYPPTVFDSDDDGAKPDKVLKLDWVYGYRGKDARCNLFVISASGELLYFVGAVAVLYDRRKEIQRHYCGHNEDITSMALHPGKRLVASGQLSGKTSDSASHVRIWDTISLSTYSIIGLGVFQAGISSVSFSVQSQGDFVLVVDDGEKHTLSVWDWQNSKLAAKTTTTTDMVVWGRFHNLDDSILVTYGKRHIYFWRLVWTSRQEGEGRIIRDKESGIFRDDIPKFVTSLAFSPLGDVVVGDSNGNITVWSRDETDAFRINHACSDHTKNAHKKSVFSLCFLEDGTLLSGGGSEIKTWDSENYYRMIKERALPDSAGYIRTLVPVSESDADGALYIGTTKNFVLEGSLQHKFKFVIQGHSDKLWALAVHPKEPCFFTAGFDMQVCRWSTIMHTVAWRIQVEKPCVSMTIDPSGNLLVVGTTDGKLIVMSAGNGSNISATQVSLDKITVVRFSPNGQTVSAGCQDGTVCLYEVMDDGFYLRKIGNLQGHKNAVTQMDWSSDNKFLQTVSADYDLFFWEVEDLNHVTSVRAMRDVDWSTQTCVLSYNIIGPWTNLKAGEDIRCVSRSGFREYLAVGTNSGSVKLYKYPSSCQKAQCYSKKSFSSQVTSVQFAMEDRYIISAGGTEAVLMQWALKPLLS
ncbi:77 kDa echinoderm microtubule-associated protein-like isoform X2 [Liolophura sinensis]|uniref:77 kDa echinoderm microtubule-associated protein-like isoform X2 n=1 Tax=Liolophura sinensis TaxID=3198878 RepID=UPI0031582F31